MRSEEDIAEEVYNKLVGRNKVYGSIGPRWWSSRRCWYWDGSEEDFNRLVNLMVATGFMPIHRALCGKSFAEHIRDRNSPIFNYTRLTKEVCYYEGDIINSTLDTSSAPNEFISRCMITNRGISSLIARVHPLKPT